MKKLVCILLAIMMTLSIAGVCAEAASAEVTPVIVTKTPNGMNYSWVPTKVIFREGANMVLRGNAETDLLYALETVDGVIYMDMEDLYRMYAPDFTVTVEGDVITVAHAGVQAVATIGSKALETYRGAAEMAGAPYRSGDLVYVPVLDFMTMGFGKTVSTASKQDKFYCIGDTDADVMDKTDSAAAQSSYRRRELEPEYGCYAGLHQFAYWLEEVQRLEPVSVYVPSSYTPDKANKTIVQLHGASGNAIDNAAGERGVILCEGAERYGYIVIFVNGYAKNCNFGQVVQPYGQFVINPETVDPKNPAGYSEKQLKDIEHSDHDVHAGINHAKSMYNVDENNMFIMGISMGACGTWHQIATNPDMFNAASPSGAFVEAEYFDWSKITTPVLYIGGTEDRNGFELMVKAYQIALSQGANIVKFETVGGAPHGGEWIQRVDMTLDFFDSYLK